MNTLTEISSERNFASTAAACTSLAYAQCFTERFREVENLSASAREAEMLRLQFPAILRPQEEGDAFCGRILYACVGISPEACGLGYYFDFDGVTRWLDRGEASPEERTHWTELRRFWEPRVTQAKTRAAYPPELAGQLPSDDWCGQSGVGFPLYRMAGTVLDYGKLLALGLDGLEAEAARMSEERGFRDAAISAIATFRSSIDHYLALAGYPDMADTLRAIRHQPPRTFRAAVQLFWLWALQSGTWNYGRLDLVLGPFLARDLDDGRISEEQAQEMMDSLWRLMHAYSNQYNNRVFIGGKGRSNEAAADRFALLAIESTRRVRLNHPQLSLRFYEGQNPALWERALDAIGEGCTFPMLYNDDVNIPAVAKAFGVSEEIATHYTPYGCGEYALSHFSIGTPSGVINLAKAVEVALHSQPDFPTFDDLWQAYAHIVETHVAALAQQQKIEYDVAGSEVAFLYISLLTSDCIERGEPLLQGGVRYLGGTLETYGNSNAADSLHVIEELVFKRHEITLAQLVATLDANFEGDENLRKKCLTIRKYGNDEATADAMARRVHEHVCHATRNQAAQVGLDSFLVVIINNWANTILGWHTGASAEGRLAGQPLANGNNPTPGSDISGATAFLNSLTRLDPSIHAGAVQNMKFTKEWFGPMRAKLDALLRAYFSSGGTQAMITVVSRDDLEAAMHEPEKWGHLMVRVGGFSIRFVELPHDAQLEVLARTLHSEMNGIVFDIQRAALHDGPGLRTLVFLKGCPLRCAWCHNPESQKLVPETGLIGKTYGRSMTLDEVMNIVRADRAYYEASGGGLTISGGEPTVQYDFCRALLAAAKADGIGTCLDTCGHCPTDKLLALAPLVDVWHYDYKATGNDLHQKFTGTDSELIRHNLATLRSLGARLRLRCPIVSGANDTAEHRAAIESFGKEDPPFETVERIPYHSTGNAKYADLGRSMPVFPVNSFG